MGRMPEAAMPITALQVMVMTGACAGWGVASAHPDLLLTGMPTLASPELVWSGLVAQVQGVMTAEVNLPTLMSLLWMGLLPSGLALALETVIVHKLSSSVTALTFTLEPVFAAVVGSALLHEDFGVATPVGGVLAISAVLIRCADPEQLQQAFKETTENIKAQFLPKSP